MAFNSEVQPFGGYEQMLAARLNVVFDAIYNTGPAAAANDAVTAGAAVLPGVAA